jgi:hypothetical protein
MSLATEGNIKSGVTIGAVAGDYPSSDFPLPGASATLDLDSATFNAKIKSSASFEYWDSSGVRHTNSGDDDIADAVIAQSVDIFGTTGTLDFSRPACSSDGEQDCAATSQYKAADTQAFDSWDVRKGTTVAGVAGDLIFNKSMANIALFDRETGTGAIDGLDPFDTIDDYNDGGTFPTEAPAGWEQATTASWIMDSTYDNGDGGGVSGNGECDGTEACIFTDRITALMWSKDFGSTYVWENAIDFCENSTLGGHNDWRLPTQKEWSQAYIDGIWDMNSASKLNIIGTSYWTSTSHSNPDPTANAWSMNAATGVTAPKSKTTSNYRALCIRDAN